MSVGQKFPISPMTLTGDLEQLECTITPLPQEVIGGFFSALY